jgi:nucleotide-binding universal stress UspA family protein
MFGMRAAHSLVDMKTVLIGYERTPQGEDALALGGLLSELLDAEPMIVTALPLSSAVMGRENLEISLSVDTAEMLAVARDRLAPLEAASRAIASHSPARGLAELSEDQGVSLIVIGSTHRGPLGQVVLGSTAERLLHQAPAPVAVAPRGFAERPNRHLLRVAVAYDGSAESGHALEAGIELAERTHGSLTLLHVVEPPLTGYGAFGQALIALEDEQRPEDAILGEGLARVPAETPVEGRVLHGVPDSVLADAAKDFDLLVLGSRGRGPLLRIALGSTSGPLARKAPCPILVLPRGGIAGGFAGPTPIATGEGR